MIDYNKRLKEASKTTEYRVTNTILDIVLQVEKILRTKKMNKKELAERMNVSPSYITKVMRGDANVSLLTITKIATALNCLITSPLFYDESIAENNANHLFSINANDNLIELLNNNFTKANISECTVKFAQVA